MKLKEYLPFFLSLIICCKLFSQSGNAIADDNLFQKLNMETQKMRLVKNHYTDNKEEKALNELLKLYREEKDMYKRVSKDDVPSIKELHHKDITRSIKIANQVIDQYFIFREEWDMEKTNIPYQFEKEIDWKLVPFGDKEWTWMLNRNMYWTHLGKAYFVTGKERYAKAFVRQVTHWIDNNPLSSLKDKRKNSIAWRTIEAGIRCENWIKSFELIKNSKHITPKFFKKFLHSLYMHGAYINHNYSNFSKTSNWGVLENHGLFNLAIFLKTFKVAPKWQKTAISRLTTCIKLQVLEDGSHWEQSPMYHNEVMHCYMNVILLAQRYKIEIPKLLIEKTKSMAYANIKWQKPNYHQPLLGDSDYTDLRTLLTTASFLFKDPVLKSRALHQFSYENIFALGKHSESSYKKMKTKSPNFLSVFQENSGDLYSRSAWDQEAFYSSLHLKKLAAGHAHDNLLHFTLYANRKDYLVDNGRYTYVDNEWRELLKSNKSHNTLGVDDLPNSVYKNAWANAYEAWSEGIYTKITPSFDYAEAINTGYKRLKDPVAIKRRMLYLKPNIWLIIDTFSAKENHKYSQYFNFPNKKVRILNNALLTTYQKDNLIIQAINDTKIKIVNSWYSSEYNLKEESKRGEIFKNTKGFASLISLLYFPEQTNLTYNKTPVYNRNNELLNNKDAEAITIVFNQKEYTLFIAYNSSTTANHFFKVNDTLIHGEIALIEKTETQTKIHTIK